MVDLRVKLEDRSVDLLEKSCIVLVHSHPDAVGERNSGKSVGRRKRCDSERHLTSMRKITSHRSPYDRNAHAAVRHRPYDIALLLSEGVKPYDLGRVSRSNERK
jgi:hypothetical protein